MLTVPRNVTVRHPVHVLDCFVIPPVTASRCRALPCSSCGKPIADKPWAVAWVLDEHGKRALRLCDTCKELAFDDMKKEGRE